MHLYSRHSLRFPPYRACWSAIANKIECNFLPFPWKPASVPLVLVEIVTSLLLRIFHPFSVKLFGFFYSEYAMESGPLSTGHGYLGARKVTEPGLSEAVQTSRP